eukprot:TRINITY_DN17264_c0_g1_i1.p1 TRINITY_DN17264_c0_g1~~TRINITY_DN17264_c0_g1_i1.p1  ORF type:complete len:717 (+),score=143.10 TRINITY_DN17264_c0_g1_i1:559-2709(+)
MRLEVNGVMMDPRRRSFAAEEVVLESAGPSMINKRDVEESLNGFAELALNDKLAAVAERLQQPTEAANGSTSAAKAGVFRQSSRRDRSASPASRKSSSVADEVLSVDEVPHDHVEDASHEVSLSDEDGGAAHQHAVRPGRRGGSGSSATRNSAPQANERAMPEEEESHEHAEDASHDVSLSDEDEEDAPPCAVSRGELLEIARKHSSGMMQAEGDSDAMDSRYWREMLDLYFVRGWISPGKNEGALLDNMLFFVNLEEPKPRERKVTFMETAKDLNGGPKNGMTLTPKPRKPYFVRPWMQNLKRVVRKSADSVDWRRSFYLNLICHTSYTLTIAICSRQELQSRKERHPRGTGPPITPLRKSTSCVYASPVRMHVDTDFAESEESTAAYPDICFSIDNGSSVLGSVEAADSDHCYCVLLEATGGAAFPAPASPDDDAIPVAYAVPPQPKKEAPRWRGNHASAPIVTGDGGEAGQGKVTLFSGFVPYDVLKGSFGAGSVGGALGLWEDEPPPAESLIMRGPGGRGEADVTVRWLPLAPVAQQQASPLPPRPPKSPKPSSGSRFRELESQMLDIQEELLNMVAEREEHEKVRENGNGRVEDEEELERANAAYTEGLQKLNEKLQGVQRQLQELQQQRQTRRSPSPRARPAAAPQVGPLGFFRAKAEPPHLPPLELSLRSLCLPWEALAYDLLYKAMPIRVDITGHIFPRLQSRHQPSV